MKLVAPLLFAALLIAACNKDDFQTKPKIEVESASPDVVPNGGTLSVNLRYTDKEGDVDDTLFVIRRRLNARDISPGKERVIDFNIATFPNTPSGNFDVSLNYLLLTFNNSTIPLPGSQSEPDTLGLRFFVKDATGNVSDTVALNKNIVVIR